MLGMSNAWVQLWVRMSDGYYGYCTVAHCRMLSFLCGTGTRHDTTNALRTNTLRRLMVVMMIMVMIFMVLFSSTRGVLGASVALASGIKDASPSHRGSLSHWDKFLAGSVRYCVPASDYFGLLRTLIGETLLKSKRTYSPVLVNAANGKQKNKSDSLRITPGLAESWSVSDDGLTYRFLLPRITRSVAFGETPWFIPTRSFSGADVVYTLRRLMKQDTAIGNILKQKIRSIEANGRAMVVVTLHEPDPLFPDYLSDNEAVIRSAELGLKLLYQDIPDLDDSLLVGTGDVRLKSVPHAQGVALVSFDSHPNTSQNIALIVVADPLRRWQLLRSGDCHIASGVVPHSRFAGKVLSPPPLGSNTATGAYLRLLPSDARGITYLMGNGQHPLWGNPEVSRALTVLLRRDTLGAEVFAPRQLSAFPAHTLVATPRVRVPVETSVHRARRVLKRHITQPVTAELLVMKNPSPWLPDPLLAVKELRKQLSGLGIRINVTFTDYNDLVDRVYFDRFDFLLGGWSIPWFDADRSQLIRVRRYLGCPQVEPISPAKQSAYFSVPPLLRAMNNQIVVNRDQHQSVAASNRGGGHSHVYRMPYSYSQLQLADNSRSFGDIVDGSWSSLAHCRYPVRSLADNDPLSPSPSAMENNTHYSIQFSRLLETIPFYQGIIPLLQFSSATYYRSDILKVPNSHIRSINVDFLRKAAQVYRPQPLPHAQLSLPHVHP